MTKVKFCGLTRLCDIEAVNELMPDYAGFVFFKKSRRYVTPEQAALLKKALDPSIKSVGVFVDEPLENVVSLVLSGVIDVVQLHGGESDYYIAELKKRVSAPVIKAFKIKSAEDAVEADKTLADYIIFDAGMGDGKTFDWSLIGRLNKPFFLAGGLTPDNAADAVHTLHPYALDVSSGIETDGFKDKEKMAAFAAAVRRIGGYDHE